MGFDFGPRYSQNLDNNAIQKIKKALNDENKQQLKFKSGTLMQRIKLIEDNLRLNFNDKAHLFKLIRTSDELKAYIDEVLKNSQGKISIKQPRATVIVAYSRIGITLGIGGTTSITISSLSAVNKTGGITV